ncbi:MULTISPECIES: thioesterase family protein [Ectothiorhodospira]|uniref:thioesterase family protein n=1 Tax=Ectothiorhodospira TaxID=1051 RepID=UPI00190649A5|nr:MULTISPECIES: thioesterase family protein [Ectothiorhodospira]MBK1671704.1 thioesterase [Ectothiorhodospira shaposhnikovii]MCG5509141.1 thioesterase family protein [Ectothiorhodospira lacustris]MCG5513026.1 thioesterase family protein [Ectothiorhodospira shaposhnikovii]MCG5520931.1 thioesterase family protein [Ectothiorhodospira lacustris]
MNLYFRLLLLMITMRFRPRLGPLDESVLRMRVLPNDLDLNRHMNNARFLLLMDLGRVDLMFRSGMGRLVVQEKWMPVIASSMMRWRRSLMPFERFELRTRVLYWDDKWFYMEQRFVRQGRTVAIGLVKGLIRCKGGHVAPERVFAKSLGFTPETPPRPTAIEDWLAMESHLSGVD